MSQNQICQIGIGTKLGGGSHDILSNPKSHVGIDTKLRGWVPPFFENYDFQVGIDTNTPFPRLWIFFDLFSLE